MAGRERERGGMARAVLQPSTPSCLSCLSSSRVNTADDSVVISVNAEANVVRELKVRAALLEPCLPPAGAATRAPVVSVVRCSIALLSGAAGGMLPRLQHGARGLACSRLVRPASAAHVGSMLVVHAASCVAGA